MDPAMVVDLTRNAMIMCLIIGAPVLVVGMLVGLLIGFLQALTQVQDQTVSFVPKILAMALTLAFTLPWIFQKLVSYSAELFANIPERIAGG
ncbi:flagellar biosynthetic protein FliQ [Bremerella cremea]|uniref:Flagellar biosynthetic protein FliQ n=1 Tax=Blastopirellula marina TaxID=124 RepID=A0A2S8FRM1_9BACT|nr:MULTISPECIES: flagellar biosynthesis protein FliQ [Pirellulaceae]PQO34825.1 flagellar biosynthetic protein FliQ [Blastopirellula marina]RCS47325.1 flagellar biosynthetic protein FliQ [Bremerella cremea]